MSRARSVSRVGVETTLTISSNGNVGFGSTIPTTRVDVAGNLNVTGVTTSTSFVGNVTGNLTGTASTATAARTAFGLSGTPDITVGIITATVISAGSTVGTAGSVLTSTGTGLQWTSVAVGPQVTAQLASLSNLIGYNNAGLRSDSANGRLEVFGTGNFRVFTSPGTFVVNPGISSIRVRVVGAGGNGGTGGNGGAAPGGATPVIYGAVGGGGGGGGGYAHKVITSFTAPRTYAVTVGSAPGGTSSFGAEVSATGGSNGSNGSPYSGGSLNPPAPGGAGGSGSGGDVNFTGATGTTAPQPGSGSPNASPGLPGVKGGASATQKGNASGGDVPGLPSFSFPPLGIFLSPATQTAFNRIIDYRNINRFPFDIFNGTTGYSGPSPSSTFLTFDPSFMSGFNGGSGTDASGNSYNPSYGLPITTTAGNGGTAAGGGGGVGANGFPGQPFISLNATVGGSGGTGGGGGGGGGGAYTYVAPSPSLYNGASGGSGGSGIVIVEW